MMAGPNELTRSAPSQRLSDFTLVTTMDELVRHLWWPGSERTDWSGVGLTFEEPYGWAIADIRIESPTDPQRVVVHFMKITSPIID